MIRDKFKLVKSFAQFPFDFFMDLTGKDTVGDVVKTGFLTEGKAVKALSDEKEGREIPKMTITDNLINQSSPAPANLKQFRSYPFTNPQLLNNIKSLVNNTKNNELLQLINRYANTPKSTRKKSKNIGVEQSIVRGVQI